MALNNSESQPSSSSRRSDLASPQDRRKQGGLPHSTLLAVGVLTLLLALCAGASSLSLRAPVSRMRASSRPLTMRLRGAGEEEGPSPASLAEEHMKISLMQPPEGMAVSFGGEEEEGNSTKNAPVVRQKRMTRAHSEVTFPSMDSYAYSVEADLGFSLFLDRRCKRVYFIGNAEGIHNTVPQTMLLPENGGDQFYDAELSSKGYDECFRLKMEILDATYPLDFQLIVVSPLTRALQTAQTALAELPRATPAASRAQSRCVSPQPEPLTMVDGARYESQLLAHGEVAAKRAEELYELRVKLQDAQLSGAAPSATTPPTERERERFDPPSWAAAPHHHKCPPAPPRPPKGKVPIMATELCRERITGLPCDRRRSVSVLKEEFPTVDFSLLKDDQDTLPERVLEDAELCRMRATRFLQWICTRPEQRIAVVSHSGFLTHLFSQFGMNKFHQMGRKDMGELRRRPLHAEMRGVLLAAHRKFEAADLEEAHWLADSLGASGVMMPGPEGMGAMAGEEEGGEEEGGGEGGGEEERREE